MAMGFFGIPALLAPALGPTLGGYIVTYAGWQLIFYINLPIGIIAIILSLILLENSQPDRTTRFDFLGFLLATVGLATLLYALSDASTDGWSSTPVLSTLLIGSISLAAFIVYDIMLANRGGQPLLDLRLFANGPFRSGMIANVFVIFALFGGLFLFPIYLQNIRGLSAFQAGLILLPQALASMVTVIIGGRLVDRLGVRAIMLPGLLILIVATWQLTFITVYSPYWWIQTMLVLRGLALGLTVQQLTVASLSEIGPRQLAQASSLSTVIRAVSSSLGIAVLATLVQTQSQVHYAHLAERVTASSQLGQLLPRLAALFVAHGTSITSAQSAALQAINGLLLQQAFTLSLQDAFTLTLFVIVLAIIATVFVRGSRKPAQINVPSLSPVNEPESDETESARAEAMFAG